MEAKLKSCFDHARDASSYFASVRDVMTAMVSRLDIAGVERLAQIIEEVREAERMIYTLGNGGSAAVAAHFVNDMGVNSLVDGERGYRIVSLADNIPSITAVANDVSFDEIFSRQLRSNLTQGDLVIGLSASGNSENVVRALEYAHTRGARTFAMSGFLGGRLREVAQDGIHIPSTFDEYGPVEDAFSVILHMVSSWLTMKQGRALHH